MRKILNSLQFADSLSSQSGMDTCVCVHWGEEGCFVAAIPLELKCLSSAR